MVAVVDPFASRGSDQLFHYIWTEREQDEPARGALESSLLALCRSSDVNPILPEQIDDARCVLRSRRGLGGGHHDVRRLQRRIVERFLRGRAAYFGAGQCRPFDDAEQMAEEGRDTFIVIKFMDEAPHLDATLRSLLSQKGVDLSRLVIVAVDNNSIDGSHRIVKHIAVSNGTAARVIYLNQPVPGAGNAARLGVDRSIATIYQMCLHDQRWERLQSATIAVSDGDTVYHPHVIAETLRIFERCPTVDGVMPFLMYKHTAALRLFTRYVPAFPEALRQHTDLRRATPVGVDLSDLTAHQLLPRWGRRPTGDDAMELAVAGGGTMTVPLGSVDGHRRRFGVLRDAAGNLAYLLDDRTLVLEQAPVSGFDAALVFLENGGVQHDEKWRWHSVIGHDLFLYWAFAGMGLPEEMVFPDTSDALKAFRAWSFAIGGQHQLSRPDLRIATGNDYQSGRVLQAAGCTVRLGPAHAFAETETDRLIKMVRNLVRRQPVFYGETRSQALDRATGLYVHMTRIQPDIERELRGYEDGLFEHTVFPERVLFPLRWILQNAVRFYAHPEPEAQRIVRERLLQVMFPAQVAERLERGWLDAAHVDALGRAELCDKQTIAEGIAEAIIGESYTDIMAFYTRTLRAFFDVHRVAGDCYEWLLKGVENSRNAVVEKPPAVHPAAVWEGDEFVIDARRGQVIGMRTEGAAS